MRGVIEIGANYVHLEKEFKEWKARGAEYFLLFEPIEYTYLEMCKRLPQVDNVKTFNLALGNKTGKVTMYTEKSNNGQSSSILRPYIHIKQYPWVVFDSIEEVSIEKLDNIEYDRTLYDFMHVDVQGYELEVFKGAIESLKYINEITTEVNKEELYKDCPMVEDIDRFLEEQGFKRVSVDWMGGNWGDAIYKRL